MSQRITRRETLKRGLAATSLLALLPDWNLPALAQDEADVPFTDIPANFNRRPIPTTNSRLLDIRTIDGPFTPADQFFTVQHFNQPGDRPRHLSAEVHGTGEEAGRVLADDLRAMHSTEMARRL